MLAFARKTIFDYYDSLNAGGGVNKSDLVDSVSKVTSLTKREAEHAINAVVHAIMSEVKAGRRVSVVGFGSFHQTRRKARVGRNPQTGTPVKIPAAKGVRFGPAATFKDVVNGKVILSEPKGPAAPAAKKAARTTKRAAKKAAKRAPAKKATKRAPARAAKRSTRKAVGRAPASKAARKAAKKTVRKAARRAPVKKAARR
jgi:DNA-binding protein HU-beta